jgi:L-malate glycosyltransferase
MSRPLKILVVCPYPVGEVPGQRLKYEQYFTFLSQRGFEIRVTPFFLPFFYKDLYKRGGFFKKLMGVLLGYVRRTLTLFRLPFYDGIYVSLNVTPLFGNFYEAAFRYLSKAVVYDIDDLVFLCRTSDQNSIVSKLRKPSKYFFLMARADHVITCTPHLDSIVKKYNPKTTDISSTVDTAVYIPSPRLEKNEVLVLGWSGSHSTSPYLKILHRTLVRLKEVHNFELLVIGDPNFSLDGLSISTLPWRAETEVADLALIDIGLYPLPDDEWVLGKSGLKAIQYMALGIPTVATAIGANFRVIEDGVSGILVSTEDEWYQALKRLIENPWLRQKIGLAARARVEERFSVHANADTYLNIFENTFGRARV